MYTFMLYLTGVLFKEIKALFIFLLRQYPAVCGNVWLHLTIVALCLCGSALKIFLYNHFHSNSQMLLVFAYAHP